MANRDVDIIFDYIVEGHSQDRIADDYGYTQGEISRILREDYGFNKGNKAWGTGKANQSGKYSFLSYEDIEDFVDSGSTDIDSWLDNRDGYGNDDNYDDDYEDYDDYDDYEDEDDYVDNNSYNNNNSYNRPQYSNYQSDDDYDEQPTPKKRKVTYVNVDNEPSFSGKERAIGLFLLIVIVAVMSIFENSGAAFYYIKAYATEGYLFGSFSIAILYVVIGTLIAKIDFKDIINRPHLFVYLALGFIACGIKFYLDFEYILVSVLAGIIGVICFLISRGKR